MNRFNQPIIGVIGGAGVAAGALLTSRLEEIVTRLGAFRDAHHPELIVWQATSAPSRSLFLEGRGPDFTADFSRIARHLKACGADVFCMVCNTAHHSAAAISAAAELELIDMIEAMFAKIKRNHPMCRRVGLICSQGARDKRVFDRYAGGLELIYANQMAQDWITAGICGVKTMNRFQSEHHPNRPKSIFQRASIWMEQQGAEVIASCCTDIAVDFDARDCSSLPLVDSLESLADAILNYWLRTGEFSQEHPMYQIARAVAQGGVAREK